MNNFEILIYLSLIMLVLKFLWTWIVVKFFMITFKSKGNSFLYTIAYLIGKATLEDLKKL